jgi:hypothetical protein
MTLRVRVVLGVVAASALLGREARAQMNYYPGGYGAYGWGGWGADPASGYMAGLGAFARGRGVYEVEDAKAQAINLQTMLQWNQALRAEQKRLREETARQDARRLAEQKQRAAELELEDGTTLNGLLSQIFDFDPAASKSSRSRAVLGGPALREIPFEWNTEAVSLCLDQMLARDALPPTLTDERFDGQRKALGDAVRAALAEDAKGDVSPRTTKRVADAVAAFRKAFTSQVPDTFTGFGESDAYLTTLASLTRLLHDPAMKKALVQIENERSITVGDLVAFMQTYNLRFGPATTERQVRIYKSLADDLKALLNEVSAPAGGNPPAGKPAVRLPAAAREAFKGMTWPQLDAHGRNP